jgi:single-stranded-DNA-specific exonuclease
VGVGSISISMVGDKLLKIAKKKIKISDLAPVVTIDAEIKEKEIGDDMLDTILRMEPFGYGNSNPSFLISKVAIDNVKKVGGGGEHLKFNLSQGGLSAIFFNSSHALSSKVEYDIVFSLRYNYWNQRKSIEMRIIDMKEA